MKSSLKNMVLVLFTITAISALLVALVNNVTKDAIAEAEQKNKDLAKLEVLPSFEGEAQMLDTAYQIGDFTVNVTEVKVDDKIWAMLLRHQALLRMAMPIRYILW